jgi:hypothetical protein
MEVRKLQFGVAAAYRQVAVVHKKLHKMKMKKKCCVLS